MLNFNKSPDDISIEEIINKTNTCVGISAEQRKTLNDLIFQYKAVFCKKPGRLKNYKHKLRMKDDKPFYMKPYPISMHQIEKVKLEIQRMLKLGIIRKSKSSYISPSVVVPKKNGDVRLCLDARGLNEKLYDEYDAPPTIEECFQPLNGANYISSVDFNMS